MNDKEKRLEELSHKWLRRTLTDDERLEFDLWFVQNDDRSLEITSAMAEDQEHYKNILLKRIKDELHIPVKRKFNLWPRIAAAAAIILIAGAGLFYYNIHNLRVDGQYANDVAPGKTGATLTLGNGKKIRLSDAISGELAKEAGVAITKAANEQLTYEIKDHKEIGSGKTNTLTTANGETYKVKLPDGSLIWLNAASSLKYPSSFTSLRSREIELTGEAYFEVAKDKMHPFIVKTDKQVVEVLGTHFNINAYRDEPIVYTTLIEGSVQVKALSGSPVKIKPGEQSILKGNLMSITEANVEEMLAWKNGYFRFNDEKIESVMRKIARWYNVEVQFQGKITTESFYGTISRTNNISQVLDFLETTKAVHFKIEGRRIMVE